MCARGSSACRSGRHDTLYDEKGQPVQSSTLDELVANVNVDGDSGDAVDSLRHGRAPLGPAHVPDAPAGVQHDAAIPTSIGSRRDALFPGTPVAIVHESRDGEWWFVVSQRYAAWIREDDVAQGTQQKCSRYTHKSPYVVVTGATAHTVFTPERPEVSGAAARDGSCAFPC